VDKVDKQCRVRNDESKENVIADLCGKGKPSCGPRKEAQANEQDLRHPGTSYGAQIFDSRRVALASDT
jgi:hypothetical protein